MRNAKTFILLTGAGAMLAGCGGNGIFNRERPDEFAVQRQAPLVIPPDFELVPPQPGAPRPVEGTASQQALDALFGGPAPEAPSPACGRSRLNCATSSSRSTLLTTGLSKQLTSDSAKVFASKRCLQMA